MITKENKIKCNLCGSFINVDDIKNKFSQHKFVKHALLSKYEFESKCFHCLFDEWNKLESKVEFHEFLGLTFEEYKNVLNYKKERRKI